MKTIPFKSMLATIRDLGFKFSSDKEENYFIRTRCKMQKIEKNGKEAFALYIDDIKVGEYQ